MLSAHRDEVLEALAHLEALDVQMPCVQPYPAPLSLLRAITSIHCTVHATA